MTWRLIGVACLMAMFALVTWLAAVYSYDTKGANLGATALIVVPLYLAIGGGLAAVIIGRRRDAD